ncbi:tyrosine-protein kinase receptor torso-like [Cydia splendana]|uniref:tyrosine-protein kinase receptor torso-like n=1 Tax=Cydia splendana TaxID=1100963 RepID=UPI0028F483B0
MAIGKIRFVFRGCIHLVCIACLIIRTESIESEIVLVDGLNYSNKTLNTIAEEICNIFTAPDDPVCLSNWLSPPVLLAPPSKLNITKLDKEVYYEISSSDFLQAVIMVSDDESHIVQHLLIPPSRNEKVWLNSTLNYTFWTTAVVDNGTHSPWLLGPKLHAWNVTHKNEQNINYTINIDRDYSDMTSCQCSNVIFTWKINNGSDTSFRVINDCPITNFRTEEVIHCKPGETEIKYSQAVPLGSKCYFAVSGHGKGGLLYDIEPQAVKNITLLPVPNGDAWDIGVSWLQPEHSPDRYRVELQVGEEEYKANVSGKATEMTFSGVLDYGLYEFSVSVCAFKGPVCMHESIRGIFPRVQVASSSVPVLGSLLAVLLLATMLVSVVVWCRRRRDSKAKLLFLEDDPEDFPKKLFPEIISDLPVTEDSWEIRPEKLQLHEVIGEGAFGVVRRGTLAPGKAVAVKMLKDYPSRDEVRSFRAETELMKSVGAHPHVVSLVGCCSGRRPLIIAEYCSRGDLLSYLRCSWDVMVSKRNAKYCNNNFETSNYRNDLFKSSHENSKLVVNKMYDLNGVCEIELTYVDLLSFCRQIAMGMEFLASNRVVHRDLAARNILVTSDRTLKIADFGLSRDIYQENQYKQKGNGKMPVKWMALESLTHRIYTTQSDVWSFGVVVWEVVTVGGAPYADVAAARLPRLLRAGYRMPRPNACTKQLYDLMLACWQARPRDRPTFTELHSELDAMLHCACAEQYLALDLDMELKPEEPRSVYMRIMEFARGKRRLGSGYASPLPRTHSNHYTSPPAPNKPPSISVSVPLCS